MPPVSRLTIPALVVVVGILVAVGTISLVEVYIANKLSAEPDDPAKIFGTRGYTAYVVYESFDPTANALTAIVRSPAANQDLRMRLKVDGAFKAERQDAILEGDVVVGTTAPVPVSLPDIAYGTRGVALLSGTAEGDTVVKYLRVGEPFPRP